MAYYNTRASAKSSESAPGCIGAIYLGKIYTCALADITDRLTPLAVWTAICKTYKLQYKDHETAGFGYFLNPPLGLPPNIAVMQGKSDSRSAIQFPNSFADIVAGRLATAERKNVFRIGSLDEEDQSWNWDLARDGPLQKTQHGFIHLIFHKKSKYIMGLVTDPSEGLDSKAEQERLLRGFLLVRVANANRDAWKAGDLKENKTIIMLGTPTKDVPLMAPNNNLAPLIDKRPVKDKLCDESGLEISEWLWHAEKFEDMLADPLHLEVPEHELLRASGDKQATLKPTGASYWPLRCLLMSLYQTLTREAAMHRSTATVNEKKEMLGMSLPDAASGATTPAGAANLHVTSKTVLSKFNDTFKLVEKAPVKHTQPNSSTSAAKFFELELSVVNSSGATAEFSDPSLALNFVLTRKGREVNLKDVPVTSLEDSKAMEFSALSRALNTANDLKAKIKACLEDNEHQSPLLSSFFTSSYTHYPYIGLGYPAATIKDTTPANVNRNSPESPIQYREAMRVKERVNLATNKHPDGMKDGKRILFAPSPDWGLAFRMFLHLILSEICSKWSDEQDRIRLLLEGGQVGCIRHASQDGSRERLVLIPKFSLFLYVNSKMEVELFVGGYAPSAQRPMNLVRIFDIGKCDDMIRLWKSLFNYIRSFINNPPADERAFNAFAQWRHDHKHDEYISASAASKAPSANAPDPSTGNGSGGGGSGMGPGGSVGPSGGDDKQDGAGGGRPDSTKPGGSAPRSRSRLDVPKGAALRRDTGQHDAVGEQEPGSPGNSSQESNYSNDSDMDVDQCASSCTSALPTEHTDAKPVAENGQGIPSRTIQDVIAERLEEKMGVRVQTLIKEFPKVAFAIDNRTDQLHVLKVASRSEQEILHFLTVKQESLPDQHVVPLLGSHQFGETFVLKLPLMGSTLKDLPQPYCTQLGMLRMLRHLVSDVMFLHEHHIAHLDLKPANIAINSYTGAPLLIDFGLSVKLDAPMNAQELKVRGSLGFQAPEVLTQTKYVGELADIWSLGQVIEELSKRLREGTVRKEVLALGHGMKADDPSKRFSLHNVHEMIGFLIDEQLIPLQL